MDVNLWDLAHEVWHVGLAGLAIVMSVVASAHAVLYKRDSRAAIAWVGFVWLVPLLGAVLYFVFGVNRVRRQAAVLRAGRERFRVETAESGCSPEELHQHLPGHTGHLYMLARVVGGVVKTPLLPGNQIDPLINGDEAYPAMLKAIAEAKQTVSFVTYIFDRMKSDWNLRALLGEAQRRGLEVRV